MKESIITVVLTICSVLLIGLAVVGKVTEDRVAPVIQLEGKNTLIYHKGDSDDVLLEDVRAEDEKDGDVSDSLRVSKVYVISEDRAVVVYVAKDKANNIGKLKREVRYKDMQENAVEVNSDEKSEESSAQTAEQTTQQNSGHQEQMSTQQETITVPDTQDTNLTAPKITMIQTEATLKVGESFNILRYIQNAVDVDGSSLSRYIHVDGAYDMSQPGVYSLHVYATSPTGATSNIEAFTLTVEP